ncbi:MAG: hypothetical protein JWO45_88, partial [Spartobacteria bacterium]|nr:hypothetical protein [Spartobacteria bacterium]
TQRNLEALYAKGNALDERFGKLTSWPGKIDTVSAVQCAAELLALIEGWTSAFSECDNGATRWAELPIEIFTKTCATLGISVEAISQAIEPWMEYNPDEYSLGA